MYFFIMKILVVRMLRITRTSLIGLERIAGGLERIAGDDTERVISNLTNLNNKTISTSSPFFFSFFHYLFSSYSFFFFCFLILSSASFFFFSFFIFSTTSSFQLQYHTSMSNKNSYTIDFDYSSKISTY